MRHLPALALLLVLTACGGGGDPEADEPNEPATTPTTTLTPTPEPSEPAEPTGAVEPNTGDRALRVGEWREGLFVRSRLAEVRYPYPPGEYRTPEAGNQFVGLLVRQCVRESYDPTAPENVDFPMTSTHSGDWYVVTPTGSQITGGSNWIDWPAPKFPELVGMGPGECLRGWMTVEVPQGTRIEKLLYRSEGEAIAEWLP